MKSLLLLAMASAMLVSSTPAASKKHKSKVKEKSFEPVASADAGGYAGRYVGIESKYWVDVKEDPDNHLDVTLYEDGARVSLRDVELIGSRLEATKILGGGVQVPFEATFGERRVNGVSAFGLLVEGNVRIDDATVLNRLFYRRESSTPGTGHDAAWLRGESLPRRRTFHGEAKAEACLRSPRARFERLP